MPSRLGAPRALAPRALMPAIAAWGTPSPVTMTVVSSAPICARSTPARAPHRSQSAPCALLRCWKSASRAAAARSAAGPVSSPDDIGACGREMRDAERAARRFRAPRETLSVPSAKKETASA